MGWNLPPGTTNKDIDDEFGGDKVIYNLYAKGNELEIWTYIDEFVTEDMAEVIGDEMLEKGYDIKIKEEKL